MTRVTLLTAPHCKLCGHALAVLERVSQDTPLTIETLALDSAEGRAALGSEAFPFPPVILLNGQAYSYGRLSERRLRNDLAERADRQPVSGEPDLTVTQRKGS